MMALGRHSIRVSTLALVALLVLPTQSGGRLSGHVLPPRRLQSRLHGCVGVQSLLQGSKEPPVAEKRPLNLETSFSQGQNTQRTDDYFWMRDDDRQNPDVLSYLKAENAYTEHVMAPTKALQQLLYQEMHDRIPVSDTSAPQRFDGYWYYSYRKKGQQYHTYARRAAAAGAANETGTMDTTAAEQVVFDENAEAAGHAFFELGGLQVSLDGLWVAYSIDTNGSEYYSAYMRAVTGGGAPVGPLLDTSGSMVWANDNATFFTVVQTADSHRAYKVLRHTRGAHTIVSSEEVYTEPDEAFQLGLSKTRDNSYILLYGVSDSTQYVMFLDAANATGEFQVLGAKQHEVTYQEVVHWRGYFLMIRADPARRNGELLAAPVAQPQQALQVIAHSRSVDIEDLTANAGQLVVLLREAGIVTAVIYDLPGDGAPTEVGAGRAIKFDEPAYTLQLGSQGDFDSPVVRLEYSSLTTPASIIDVNTQTGNQVVKKVEQVGGGFNASKYETQRLAVAAPDAVQVPITLVYRASMFQMKGSQPLLLDAYGAYGSPSDPYFSRDLLSLLDRGFAYGIAHVRGGGDLGAYWHEDGKLLTKKNTFSDLIACAQYLQKAGYVQPGKLAVWGRSAGGLTVGAAVAMQPNLFAAAILDVPFVDVLSTMSDPSLPLTVPEYEEWGNPSNETFYNYMEGYSPYDNVAAVAYPHMLVTGGLNDPRVGYWESAKFTAKVRALRTSDNLQLLKVNMGAGHFAVSGLYDRLHEEALKYAFLLNILANCTALAFSSSSSSGDAGGSGIESYIFVALGAIILTAFAGVTLHTIYGGPQRPMFGAEAPGTGSAWPARAKEVAMNAFPQTAGYRPQL